MGLSYLATRVAALKRAQNRDGGWSYFPGKQTWLEPTIYAALALHGEPEADRAWALISSWQNPDGGWRPTADVEISHAGTALCVTAAAARGEFGEPLHRGVNWLLGQSGVESQLYKRALLRVGKVFGMVEDQRDLSLKGWPWKPDTASWVEPTAHALVALKQAAAKAGSNELRERVRLGEGLLMDVQCADGGWNYGNRTARGEDLRSYPETTALALIGLQGRPNMGPSFDLAKKMLAETASPLARAWLTIAMRLNGSQVEEPASEPIPDVLITALEALAAAEGNHRLLRTTA